MCATETGAFGRLVGVDLMKKLDSKVSVDLLGTTGATAAAPTSVVPKTTHTPTETSLEGMLSLGVDCRAVSKPPLRCGAAIDNESSLPEP